MEKYSIRLTDHHNGFYAIFDPNGMQISEEFGYYHQAQNYLNELMEGKLGGTKYPNITEMYTYPEAAENNIDHLEIYIFVVRNENVIVWQGVMWYAEDIAALQPLLDRYKVVKIKNPILIDRCVDEVIAQWITFREEELDRLKELIGLENYGSSGET